MIYRPLGTTGLELSVIGLGGHWRTADGRRYYDRFPDDEVPAQIVQNRREILAACRDAGINYIDITTAAECLAYGRALAGCRDRFIVGADDYQWSARNPECCNSQALIANVERCLSRLNTDYLDIWRVTAEVRGRNTDAEIEAVLDAARQLRDSGKIRFLGVSSHHPGWIQAIVTRYEQFQLVIVPCTPLGCGRPHPAAPPEPLRTIASRGLGLMTIKPFAGGMLFNAADDPSADHRLARLTLQYILQSRPEITCVLAGMTTLDELSTAIEAASAGLLNPDEVRWLLEQATSRIGTLPPEYAWLQAWQYEVRR